MKGENAGQRVSMFQKGMGVSTAWEWKASTQDKK